MARVTGYSNLQHLDEAKVLGTSGSCHTSSSSTVVVRYSANQIYFLCQDFRQIIDRILIHSNVHRYIHTFQSRHPKYPTVKMSTKWLKMLTKWLKMLTKYWQNVDKTSTKRRQNVDKTSTKRRQNVDKTSTKYPTVKMSTKWLKMSMSSDPAWQPPAGARCPRRG
jgi:hypothetical protein